MHFYPPWFDYAKWTLLAAGVMFFLLRGTEPAGSRRSFYKLLAGSLFAGGMIFGSASGILFNFRAPHVTVVGTVFDVYKTEGRSASTSFRLRMPSGEVDNLSLRWSIYEIANNEQAQVTYQAGSMGVLSIRVLDGPFAGYNQKADNGSFGSWLLLVAALCIAIFTLVSYSTDRSAHYESLDEVDSIQPDGDVDTQSLLNLSK